MYYLLIACSLPGYVQAYKTANKITAEALKGLRAWAANWGLPYSVKSDSGPAFRQTGDEKLEKIEVRVIHSSAPNA